MSAPTPEIDALRPVIDPELDISIVDLGLVRGVGIDDGTGDVEIELTLTSPMCPLGPEIVAAVRTAALGVVGVQNAQVDLVWSPPWDPRRDATEDVCADLGIWD